jgi:Ni,Fe-hydrogenase III large subunit/Ni,Fe-hydrogenase III component G
MNIDSLFKELSVEPAPGKAFVADVANEDFRRLAERVSEKGYPLSLMYATDDRKSSGAFHVHAVFSVPKEGYLTLRTEVSSDERRYPSLTATIMAAHWYERQMQDQFGIVPVGHPDPRRLMHHENIPEGTAPMLKDFAWDTKLKHANVPYPMGHVEGKGIYEIPVGPIHAGIIEPGHFRFNVRGERIITLEGKLFFKHKGIEKLVEGKTPHDAMPFVERVSGDMVVGHALAFVQAVESAVCAELPERALYLRTVYGELERITMHIFDIGNMAGMGTGFTFMAAQGFRMVEVMRRMHKELVGHRFLRGAITLGGVRDLSKEKCEHIRKTLTSVEADVKRILDIAFANDGLMERLETTGILKKDAALAYGAQGVPARASGVDIDVRRDHPYAAYDKLGVQVMTKEFGDVGARFRMRGEELAESFRLIRACLDAMPGGESAVPLAFKKGSAFGSSESWRGEVLDWVRLDEKGEIDRLVIRDPSFCNWPLFGELAPGNIVPDFPLCNKSLNLSYAGTDL